MNEIEKAAQEKYPVNHDLPIMSKIGLNYSAHQGFIEGAEWQQEQNLLMHEKQKDKLVFESLHKTYEANKYSLAIAFGDWLRYESVCFPEHKDKSIEELLEIYKKEKAL